MALDELARRALGDDADDRERFLAALAAGPWRVEQAEHTVYLHLRNGAGDAALTRALMGREFSRRHATLEDVFLTLTGHTLRD